VPGAFCRECLAELPHWFPSARSAARSARHDPHLAGRDRATAGSRRTGLFPRNAYLPRARSRALDELAPAWRCSGPVPASSAVPTWPLAARRGRPASGPRLPRREGPGCPVCDLPGASIGSALDCPDCRAGAHGSRRVGRAGADRRCVRIPRRCRGFHRASSSAATPRCRPLARRWPRPGRARRGVPDLVVPVPPTRCAGRFGARSRRLARAVARALASPVPRALRKPVRRAPDLAPAPRAGGAQRNVRRAGLPDPRRSVLLVTTWRRPLDLRERPGR